MSQPNTIDSSPAVHLGQDDGEAFRLGPLEIIVKENGSGTRMNLAVASAATPSASRPTSIPSTTRRSMSSKDGWG